MSETGGLPLADVARLRGLLARWERLWRERDAITLKHLRPGLTDAQIDAATRPLGVLLPVEAREWFGWHDGVTRLPDDVPSASAADAGPPLELRTLAECVAATEFHRRAAQLAAEVGVDPDYAWSPSWFVLAEAGNGDPMIIDCAVPPGAVTPIRRGGFGVDPDDLWQVKGRSLTEVIATWVQLIEDGVYTYDPARLGWPTDAQRLTPEQIRAALY